MRHMYKGRQLSRDTEHRKALRRNLIQSLFEHGKIRTTYPKAKECRALAEQLITLARTKTINARRRVIQLLQDRRLVDENQEFIEKGKGSTTVIQKLFNDIAPGFEGRNGGYTRIIKLAEHRIGDGGSVVLLQLLTEEHKPTGTARKSAGLRRKRAEKRRAFANKLGKKEKAEPKAESAEPAAPTQA
ncbi:MAG: 50S ribosomal protein L17 [Tepidisphaerales bacterium]